jgi:hypothetical protein
MVRATLGVNDGATCADARVAATLLKHDKFATKFMCVVKLAVAEALAERFAERLPCPVVSAAVSVDVATTAAASLTAVVRLAVTVDTDVKLQDKLAATDESVVPKAFVPRALEPNDILTSRYVDSSERP